MNLKLIVLSDLHLGRPGEAVNGLDTEARLRAAIETINRDHANADCVLLAGDLADNGDVSAYHMLAQMLGALPMPVHITLGNHDDRDAFLSVFGPGHDHPQGRVSAAMDLGGHRIILLDTSEPGRVDGHLCEGRKAWLHEQLALAANQPVIIVMHHHANPLSLPVDEIALKDAGAFAHIVKSHDDVRLVLSGHVHITTSSIWHGIPMVTMAGSHYSVSPHVPGVAGTQQCLEGPAQMAVILGNAEGLTVHFQDYMQRHLVMARGLFS